MGSEIMAAWRRGGWLRIAILAAVLLLSLSSCDQTAAATTDAPPTSVTVTVQALRTPTPVPTSTPAPTPRPTATATPLPPPPTATPRPPAPPAPQGCYPLTNGGNCYEPGEYCRTSDHGTTGIAGDGKRIICTDNNGWRWEPY